MVIEIEIEIENRDKRKNLRRTKIEGKWRKGGRAI